MLVLDKASGEVLAWVGSSGQLSQAREVDGATGVALAEVRPDRSDFKMDYDPSHPAANAQGYVMRPNVDTLVEAMDMREAQRAYEANLNVIETARSMDSRTLDIIKR